MSARNRLSATLYGLGPGAAPKLTPAAAEPQGEPIAAHDPPPKAASPRGRRVGIALVLAAAAVASGTYALSMGHESTDDAQVDADISIVSPRVAGTLITVQVISHQQVAAGDTLAEIDRTDFTIAMNAAQASFAEAEAALIAEQPALAITVTETAAADSGARAELSVAQEALSAAKRDAQGLQAQLARAEAEQSLADANFQRAVFLEREGALARAERDAREASARAAAAQANAIRESMAAASARVRERGARISGAQAHLSEIQANSPRVVETRRAFYEVARARRELALARLQKAQSELGYTQILAPVAGSICGKLASVGDTVAPGVAVLSICQNDRLWITANFRETQLRHMSPGQRAQVYVDALNLTLRGRVSSIAASTGSRLSLLPPENASGNYVKVVQRVPVRIDLERGQPGLERLRAGMSVVPSVDVRR